MAANGYILNADVTVVWDGVSQRIPRGTVIDTPASSGTNLAATIGAGNLTALTTQQKTGMGGQSVGGENLVGGGQQPYQYQN